MGSQLTFQPGATQQTVQQGMSNVVSPQTRPEPPTNGASLYGTSGQGPTSNPYSQGTPEWYTFNNFQTYGYNPTQAEVASAASQWSNKAINGSAGAISQYMLTLQQQNQANQNNPQAIYQKQQQQYLQDAPKFADQVNQMFQQTLGRAATQDELTHFGAALASGSDQYQIAQSLQQTPEYQQTQAQNFTNKLTPQLQKTNSDYFNQYILPSIQASQAQSGQTFDSSGYANSLAQAAKQQNYDLQNYMAQIQAGQYGQSTQNAAANYQPYLSQQYGLQNAGVSNSLQNQAYATQRTNNLQDYYNQLNAYNQYLSNYGKRSGNQGGGQLAGGLLGAGLGAYFGGPAGAMTGYQAGSGLGGAIGAFL